MNEPIALQYTRGRAHRKTWATITDAGIKLMARTLASGDNDTIARRLTAMTGKAARQADVDAMKRLAADTDAWEAIPHQNSAIEAMARAAPEFAPHFARRRWRLARFAKPVLLTSDWPIALWHRTPTGPYRVGLGNANEIRFPLDARHALVMTAEDGAEFVWDVGEYHAKDFNRLVATRGYEWIYHTPDIDPLAAIDLPPPRPPIEVSGPPTARGLRSGSA